MSSVGSKDGSSRNDEVVRRNREDYRSNEADMIKKHKAELRRISEQHYAEIENLKAEHQKQMESMHRQSSDTISERDHKYQKSMDDIRDMHTKALKKTAEENGRREDALRRAIKGDADQSKEQNDTRFEKLSKDYRNNLMKAEEVHQETSKAGREAQEQAIAENRNKLERAFQKQTDSIRDERNEKVKQLQTNLTNYREFAEGRNKDQELRHLSEKNKASDTLMRTVGNERQDRVENEQMLREGFQDGLSTQKERYEKAMKREREALQASSQDLKATVGERLDGQVGRLEREVQDLRQNNNREVLMTKHQAKREIANVKDAYSKNIEDAMEQRNEAIRASNERSAADVQKVRKELAGQLTESGRFLPRTNGREQSHQPQCLRESRWQLRKPDRSH